MPLDEMTLKAAEPVITALESCSVSRAIWHLDANERWKVVRDTLLGHPQIRGNLRPRDLPLDGEFRNLLAGIAAFHSRQPQTNKPSHQYCFGDWLYLFAVLVEPQLHGDVPSALPIAHQAVYECFREIRNALPWPKDVNPNSGEFSKTCPILHRLIAAVGWSIKDWHSVHHMHRKLPLHESATQARLAARAVKLSGKLGKLTGRDAKRINLLSTPSLQLLTIMTKHVQDYIGRGQRHWLMRGASAWCAQVLAFVRDEIPDIAKGSLLLSDSDVVVSFLMPANTGLNANQVADMLWERWRNGTRFLERFPRLREVPAVVDAFRDAVPLDPRMVFPEISIRIGKPTSLLELCTAKDPSGAEPESQTEETAVRGHSNVALRVTDTPCSFVTGDISIAYDPPSWLETRGDNDGHKRQESFGFTSLVWSLCGTTLKAHWFQNASREVSQLASCMRMMPIHHGEWLKWLRSESEPIAFLKLDGNGVGNIFQATPIPRRPYLSLELGRLIFTRVMAATKAVIHQHVELTNLACGTRSLENMQQKEEPNVPCDGHDIPLAADMVYVGGDDIFFCLPHQSVTSFLAGFSAPVSDDFPEVLQNLSFKFSCVTLPSAEEIHPKSDRMQDANLWASQLASDDVLKESVKAFLQNGDERLFDAIRERSLTTHGFLCDISAPEIPPHTGKVNGSVVHGVYLRLKDASEGATG
jgi:hypothetical protein